MLTISQASSAAEIAAVRELMREYAAWAFTLVPGSDQVPAWKGFNRSWRRCPVFSAPPAGRSPLARQDEQPAGCVCLKAHDAATSELKRLYVRPAFRGQNIGLQLVKSLIEAARQSSYQKGRASS